MSDAMATPVGGGSSACWNCGQPLRAGTVQCLWCGVAQQQGSQPTQFLMAPGLSVAAPGAVIPPAPQTATAVSQPASAHQASPHPASAQHPAQPARVRTAELDPAFAGTVAGVGAQILAFTIDTVMVVAVSVAVLLISSSGVFAALAAVELLVFLWVLEARTGATVGTALLRLRTARDDSPFSPGIGRSFVRRTITGAGFLAGGIGAWVVVASAAWDRTGKNRSWADAAARTQLVAIAPRRRTTTQAAVPVSAAAPGAAPSAPLTYPPAQAPIVLAAPQVVNTLARQTAIDENSASQSRPAPEPVFEAQTPAPQPVEVVAPVGEVPSARVPESLDGTILLVFDTGQREQFATPVAVNLGRNPVATDATDSLVTVNDPDSTVSKTHVRLEHSRGRTWVTDGGSTNGTDLLEDDGDVITLTPGNRVLVEEGVRVRMGNRAFTISLMLGGEK
ncbi:MAG: RDD family protein [Microbacteriaceae bacterium]